MPKVDYIPEIFISIIDFLLINLMIKLDLYLNVYNLQSAYCPATCKMVIAETNINAIVDNIRKINIYL